MPNKHAPGPWHVYEIQAQGLPNCIRIIANWNTPQKHSMREIAQVHLKELSINEHKATAKLIAAAPELLQALQELLNDKYLSDTINNDRMKNARLAVSKALD
jgi:hypothetical protein